MTAPNPWFSFRTLLQANQVAAGGMTVDNHMLFFTISKQTNLRWMYDRPESMLFLNMLSKTTQLGAWGTIVERQMFFCRIIQNEPIRNLRYGRPDSNFIFQAVIENKTTLSRRHDFSGSMLLFKCFIENRPILSRRLDCPKSTLLFENSFGKWNNSKPHVSLSRIKLFSLELSWKQTNSETQVWWSRIDALC